MAFFRLLFLFSPMPPWFSGAVSTEKNVQYCRGTKCLCACVKQMSVVSAYGEVVWSAGYHQFQNFAGMFRM